MSLTIHTELAYNFVGPTDFLLQLEAAMIPEQEVIEQSIATTPVDHFNRVHGQDQIGDRIWIRCEGQFSATYKAKVTPRRVLADIETLRWLEPHLLPGEAIQYLMDSRYCPADRFQHFVEDEFGHLSGGARIVAMQNWIANNFSYTPGASDAFTTALETLVDRRGVCRDYAHVMITMARASAIPARFVSGYGPDVTPQDFHAVAEVFLADDSEGGGAWHIVDATGMAEPSELVKIAVGRDAADCSFLTSYGQANLINQQVSVTRD